MTVTPYQAPKVKALPPSILSALVHDPPPLSTQFKDNSDAIEMARASRSNALKQEPEKLIKEMSDKEFLDEVAKIDERLWRTRQLQENYQDWVRFSDFPS